MNTKAIKSKYLYIYIIIYYKIQDIFIHKCWCVQYQQKANKQVIIYIHAIYIVYISCCYVFNHKMVHRTRPNNS